MYCVVCGQRALLPTMDIYCVNCGAKLVNECPNCGEPIRNPTSRFCPSCGQKLLKTGLAVIDGSLRNPIQNDRVNKLRGL